MIVLVPLTWGALPFFAMYCGALFARSQVGTVHTGDAACAVGITGWGVDPDLILRRKDVAAQAME